MEIKPTTNFKTVIYFGTAVPFQSSQIDVREVVVRATFESGDGGLFSGL